MIRATTGGVMRSYRKNLMSSFIASNKARDTVLTQRNFNSYAEAPADAAKAFRLRMSRLTVNSQYKICEDTYYKYQGAFSCLDTVDKLIDTENGGAQLQTLKSTTLKMLNDPTGDARTQLAKVLDEMSETIIQNMNQKYGDTFIFAGADGYNVPFEVTTREDGTKQLLYRGVPVDAQKPELLEDSTGTPVTLPAPNDDQYLLASAETMPVSELPNLHMGGDGKPMVVLGDDGRNYYLKAGIDLSASSTDSLDEAEYEALSDIEKAKYIKTTEFIPPIDPNKVVYYKKDQLIAKGEYDKTYDSLMKDENGTPITVSIDGEDRYIIEGEKAPTISKTDYEAACEDADKLAYLMNEKRFVDIGLGFQENEQGKLIESSGFNECLNGLTFLGYGLDEDGDPKNIYSIVQRLKEITESVPDGAKWSQETYDEFDALVGKLEKASSDFKTEYANMDAGTLKLKNNLDILEDNFYNLDTQTSNLEDADMVESITSFIWAEYAYNAALKVGNSILSQSLMDYMT